jgi:hypothetical protein
VARCPQQPPRHIAIAFLRLRPTQGPRNFVPTDDYEDLREQSAQWVQDYQDALAGAGLRQDGLAHG